MNSLRNPFPLALATAAAIALALTGSAPAAQTQAPAQSKSASAAAPLPALPTSMPARAPEALGCLIDASAVINIGAPVIGVLEAVLVERGDFVERGQVLAQLDANVERKAVELANTRASIVADIESARAQKEYAALRAQRTASLSDLKFVSSQMREQTDTEATMAAKKLDQALEQQVVAEKELLLARAQLAQRTILSPISGVVVERYAAPGERIENQPIVKLARIDPLRVEVVLPATLFGKIKLRDRMRVQPELAGHGPRTATVTVVDRVIDAASNTFRVRLSLPNSSRALPSGVRCKVDLGT